MGGNRSLRGKPRAQSAVSNDPWAYRFTGTIRDKECWLDLYVAHPEAVQSNGLLDASRALKLSILIDTGATASCIQPGVAQRLNLPVIGKQSVRGVNSVRDCDVVAVLFVLEQGDKLAIKFTPMIVADIDAPMILGMSEIGEGVLIVDGPSGTWKWSLPNTVLRATK